MRHNRRAVRRSLPRLLSLVLLFCGTARADQSKARKEGDSAPVKGAARGKNKLCCGYPITEELGYRTTYYWVASQDKLEDNYLVEAPHSEVELYTRDGFYLGSFPERFVDELKMEGTGWLSDGRILNYAGRCRYGVGTCYEVMDPKSHPYGRGAGRRPLVPFTSVAIDRRLLPIGETIYIPEFDGLRLPDGSYHDGCVRADDTGGAIKRRLMDFFVVELVNFRWMDDQLWGLRLFTPHIEDPRCEYLREP